MRSRPVPVVGEFYLGHPITHKYYSSKNKKHPNSINRPTPKLWLLNRWTKQFVNMVGPHARRWKGANGAVLIGIGMQIGGEDIRLLVIIIISVKHGFKTKLFIQYSTPDPNQSQPSRQPLGRHRESLHSRQDQNNQTRSPAKLHSRQCSQNWCACQITHYP